MADNSMFDTPDSPPPPAYEFCPQEFDQKVSHAIEESSSLPPPQPVTGDDEWEVWDDAAFTAAVAGLGLSEGSSSSAPPPPVQPAAPRKFMQDAIDSKAPEIQPLRIAKKTRSPSPKREKERPSWYAEAQLGEHAPSASSQRAAPSNASQSIPPQPVYPERECTPPPVFEAVGPSLDGPPYEDPAGVQVVLSYNPPGSRPESPLQSPVSPPTRYDYQLPPPPLSPPPPIVPQQHYQQPQQHYQQPQPQYQPAQHHGTLPVPAPRQTPSPGIPSHTPARHAHQSMPAPIKPVQKMGPRPITTYNPSSRVAFNPQVAYTRKLQTQQSGEEPLPGRVDASAFYNSSVASLTSGPRRAPTLPQHRPSYNQPAPAPNPPAPVQQPYQMQQQQQPVGGYQYTNHNYGGYPAQQVQQQYNPYQQPAQQYPPQQQQQVTAAPGVVVTQTWRAPNPYMGQQYGRGW